MAPWKYGKYCVGCLGSTPAIEQYNLYVLLKRPCCRAAKCCSKSSGFLPAITPFKHFAAAIFAALEIPNPFFEKQKKNMESEGLGLVDFKNKLNQKELRERLAVAKKDLQINLKKILIGN